MALANVWPGRHKVIGEGFPSFVGVRVARQLRPAHCKNLQKSTAGFSHFPLEPPSFCAVCVHPSSGMVPFFCFFFWTRQEVMPAFLENMKKKQLVFVVSQCPDLWAFCGCVKETLAVIGNTVTPIQTKSFWRQSTVLVSFLLSSPLLALKLSCETVKHPEQQMGTIRVLNHGHYSSSQRFYFGILNVNCLPLNLKSPRWHEWLISQPRGFASPLLLGGSRLAWVEENRSATSVCRGGGAGESAQWSTLNVRAGENVDDAR